MATRHRKVRPGSSALITRSEGADFCRMLLARTTRAGVGALRDARVVYLAANYIVGVALLESLQARLTAGGGLCV